MSAWLEQKYIGLLSTRLRNFKRKGPTTYNFSCPICNDSQTDNKKARGYIYSKKDRLSFHCHNCTASMSVPNLIKFIDINLHNEFALERLQGSKPKEQVDYEQFVEKMKKPVFINQGPLRGLKKISQLAPTSKVKQFCVDRKIPNPYHSKLFSCPNFMQFTNQLVPGKFDEKLLENDETRLLIPFIDKDKNVHCYQGRAIGKSKVKYITIVLNESIPKVYGLDTVDFNDDVIVVEGPLDSMFIPNSIATAGGDLVSAISSFPKDKIIVCYDNEPRNKETVKKIDKAIMNGYRVCIWPDNFEHKDINDAVLAGLTSQFIQFIIKSNSYRDLPAKLRLNQWSKV